MNMVVPACMPQHPGRSQKPEPEAVPGTLDMSRAGRRKVTRKHDRVRVGQALEQPTAGERRLPDVRVGALRQLGMIELQQMMKRVPGGDRVAARSIDAHRLVTAGVAGG